VAGDILDYAGFFAADEALPYDEAAFEKRLRKPPEASRLLARFKEQLAAVEPFEVPALEKAIQDFVQAEGIKPEQIIHALRVAVTGKAIGFGLYESLAILGKEHCLARIDRALKSI
jgi:glutamyl-tRNA synthetase